MLVGMKVLIDLKQIEIKNNWKNKNLSYKNWCGYNI